MAGYRRLYINSADGAALTAKVKDEAGRTVAKIADGKLVSRTDRWIGITTSDESNWLRIPVDGTYRVEIKADKATKLALRASEYAVSDNKVVREVTKDDTYDWSSLELPDGELVTGYAARLRFVSSDPGVAKVSAKGKVTAVKTGSCRIYVQTINGIWKTVNVSVQ